MAERKRGMFEEPNVVSKRLATVNPEYQTAFHLFDANRNGSIDLQELNNALMAVKNSVESSTAKAFCYFKQPFQPLTLCWLASRFAPLGSGAILYPQFAEMMQYLESVKNIFKQMDIDLSGDLDVCELSRALHLSGFNVAGRWGIGGDALSLMVAEKIGRLHDVNGDGKLSFDEFVQLRLEWDCYIDAWAAHVPMGVEVITPDHLIAVLEAIKKSCEPISALAFNPALSAFSGFDPYGLMKNLLYTSMFQLPRPFTPRTVELLLVKFGKGSVLINFEQFCMMMDFIKVQKQVFMSIDLDRSGSIDINELSMRLISGPYGITMVQAQLIPICQRYDQDGSGVLEFDEFLQMMTEQNLWQPI